MGGNKIHAGELLSYKDLIALKECKDKYLYRKLSLHRGGYGHKKFAGDVFQRMAEAFRSGKPTEEVCALTEALVRAGTLREWFDFDIQYQKEIEANVKSFSRMASYMENFSVQDVGIQAVADVDISFREVRISGISVNAHAVLQKDGKTTVVLFEKEENPFSVKARKEGNHPSHSIALISAYLAFEPVYGPDVMVETWYLKGKDDKADRLADRFEEKEGKNIASAFFGNRDNALKRLRDVAGYEEERKCGSCMQRDICHFSCEVRRNSEEKAGNAPCVADLRLTPAQEEVAAFMEGAMCCIAVPGAGKTFSLANRLANLLKNGVAPESILFVTFTKKAAGELKKRVMALMGAAKETGIPNICTFNALGYAILRENPLLLGQRVKIADTTARMSMIKAALSACPPIKNVSYDGAYLEFGLLRMLDRLFDEIKEDGKESFSERHGGKKDTPGILAVYDEYRNLEKENGFISYDMQVSLVNRLFRKFPSLAERYADRYRYIMVDEFQDTSQEQAEMVYAIARKHGNIVVVGDDDQSIYGWRGGSNRFLLDFVKDFPSAKTVFMTDNFRSNNGILNPANELICRNKERFEKKIVGHKEAKFRPAYWRQATASDVAELVKKAIGSGYRPGDIAVLARTNKRLTEVEAAVGGSVKTASPKDYLREDTVFTLLHDVFALFYSGMEEDVPLYRFLSFFGAKCTQKEGRGRSLYADLVARGMLPEIDKMQAGVPEKLGMSNGRSAFRLAAFRLMEAFKCIQHSHGVGETLSELCRILLGMGSHPVAGQLSEKADEKAIVKIRDLFRLMEDIVLFSDDTRVGYEPREDTVNLLTAHDAKGKEFPLVIIYATEDFKDSPEENRLLYVAMTRAKDTLLMTESIYSTCELLPYFAASVNVH